jgi:transcriptional regulator with XRE-family HTH domain
MRKSRDRPYKYRPGTSTKRGDLTTFRAQMADYAKGDVLIELRKKAGLTRERAAADMGVTTKTLFTWEKENGGIRADNARKLADFYGVEDPSTLIMSTEDGGDQLDRIEQKVDLFSQKVDLLLTRLGLDPQADPAEALERELAEAAAPSRKRTPASASGERAPRRATR